MDALNGPEVEVELYESRHKFTINEYHKKWQRLKLSIGRHINAIVGQRLDFNNHRFEILNESANAYIPLDQTVYEYIGRRQQKIRILVVNRPEDKRKPTNSVMKEWKDVPNVVNSERVVQEINGLKQLAEQRQRSDLLLTKLVVKRLRDRTIDWEQVSKLMERQLFPDWDGNQCRTAFTDLIEQFIQDLQMKNISDVSDSSPAFSYLLATDLRQLAKNLQVNAIDVRPHLLTALNDFIQSHPKATPKPEPIFRTNNYSMNSMSPKQHILMESRLSTEAKPLPIPIRNYCETQIDWFSSPDNASPPSHGI